MHPLLMHAADGAVYTLHARAAEGSRIVGRSGCLTCQAGADHPPLRIQAPSDAAEGNNGSRVAAQS